MVSKRRGELQTTPPCVGFRLAVWWGPCPSSALPVSHGKSPRWDGQMMICKQGFMGVWFCKDIYIYLLYMYICDIFICADYIQRWHRSIFRLHTQTNLEVIQICASHGFIVPSDDPSENGVFRWLVGAAARLAQHRSHHSRDGWDVCGMAEFSMRLCINIYTYKSIWKDEIPTQLLLYTLECQLLCKGTR